MPSSCAFASLDPAASPAITRVGFLRHAACHLRPQRHQTRFGVIARQLAEAAGKDHGFACKRAINLFRLHHHRRRPANPLRQQLRNDIAVALFGKEVEGMGSDDDADIRNFL